MARRSAEAWALLVVAATCATPAWAQAAPPGDFPRGPGSYLSWWKLGALVALFLAWVTTTDWANIDALRRRQNHVVWNPILVGVFVAGFLAAFLIPLFFVGYPLAVLTWLVPLFLYIRTRNAAAEDQEKVMTPAHLRYLASVALKPLGIKIAAERQNIGEGGPNVKLIPQGGATEMDNQGNLVVARQSPGFTWSRELISEAMQRRAESLMLDFTADAVGVRYEIDGVWHTSEGRDRESGDAILWVMKTISGLKADDRRSRQEGTFQTQIGDSKSKTLCRVISQGTKSGERTIVRFDDGAQPFKALADLGIRDKLQDQLKELLQQPTGILLFSAPPDGGLSTSITVALNAADRFMRSFVAVEDVDQRHTTVENVPITTFSVKGGETPLSVLPKLVRLYPDVIVLRELADAETGSFLCAQVKENRQMILGIRAKDAAEALLRVLALKVPADEFAPVITAVINQRLVRKLCETCREAYQPPDEVLKKLGIPAGKIDALYRPPEQPEEVCRDCGGIGYNGRTGIYELLMVDDTIRELLIKSPKSDLLRAAARKGGMRSLQQEGLLLVLKGATSLAELMRVMS